MKLKQTGKIYTLSGITQTELEALFHPHNVTDFVDGLQEPHKTASTAIWSAWEGNGYGMNGGPTCQAFVAAMKKVV